MDSKKFRKALEWVRQQQNDVNFKLPDRQPDEEDATESQKSCIRHFTDGKISEDDLAQLGRGRLQP